MTSEKLMECCKYYWYGGILKGIQITKNRPSDYSKIAKDCQAKLKEIEDKEGVKDEVTKIESQNDILSS